METIFSSYQKTKARPSTVKPVKLPRLLLLIVLAYEAAGAFVGGVFLIAGPDGHLMDMPVNMMHGVFRDFLIPGIILFSMGILSTVAFIATLRKRQYDWFISGTTLIGWVIWFVTEIVIIQELHWLHIMWALPIMFGMVAAIPIAVSRNDTPQVKRVLLYCGIFSSLWYLFANIYVPMQYEGYSIATYTVSELSAIGAPTRILWVLLVLAYPLLTAAFGWGILKSSAESHSLRIVGILIVAYSIFNFYWPPMHMRGIEPTLTDMMHITWGMVTLALMISLMSFGAGAFGTGFRIYTVACITLFVLFGILMGLEAPNIPTNGPTPMIGIWERVNIGIFMLWVAVLAIMLLRMEEVREPHQRVISLN